MKGKLSELSGRNPKRPKNRKIRIIKVGVKAADSDSKVKSFERIPEKKRD